MRHLLCALLVLITACAGPQAGSPPAAKDMRLTPANAIGQADHLILTVPQGARPALMAESRRIEDQYGVTTVAEWPLNSIGVHCLVLRAGTGAQAQALAEAMDNDPGIRTAQVVREFRTLASTAYSDDLFSLQRGLHEIRAPEAHRAATGKDVKIAIIDTGIDFDHPDLASRKAASVDMVGTTPGATAPPEQHGTAIAGVIAADGQNSRGIVGVAPDAKILGFRACWQPPGSSTGRCNSFSIARAVNAAILKKADVINMSLGGPFDPLVADLIESAQRKGATVVAAREQAPDAYFPASMPGVVAVWSSASRSDRGVMAPGVDIISTTVQEGYDFFSGASVSAAHATGVAALMIEKKPGLDTDSLTRALMRSGKAPSGQGGLDACSAIAAVGEPACE